MMKLSSSFARERELIIVDAQISGPASATKGRLVLDTGAAATTLVPELIERIVTPNETASRGPRCTPRWARSKGFWTRVAELTVLGVSTPDFALAVFPLGHQDVDGLVGMNFLRHFNFEIRPAERRILVALIHR